MRWRTICFSIAWHMLCVGGLAAVSAGTAQAQPNLLDDPIFMAPPEPYLPSYIGPDTGSPLRPLSTQQPAMVPERIGPIVAPPPLPVHDPTASPSLALVYPPSGSTIVEGRATVIVWNSSGPIESVRLEYSGQKCRLGGRSRGSFSQAVARFANSGTYSWEAPWMDATQFKLRLIGYNGTGRTVAEADTEFAFLPTICEGKPADCICVSKAHQRLYYLRDGQIARMNIVSTAMRGYTTPRMGPGSHDRRRGAMGRVFRKAYAPRSRMYDCVMYYWLQITSSGSHGIHATSPPFYHRLGRPASHGCIRQHKADAKALYSMVPVGTPVYVR